jgi:hypothetical protein
MNIFFLYLYFSSAWSDNSLSLSLSLYPYIAIVISMNYKNNIENENLYSQSLFCHIIIAVAEKQVLISLLSADSHFTANNILDNYSIKEINTLMESKQFTSNFILK